MKRFYSWTRDLHLYIGLLAAPFVLVFAISTMVLNHPSETAPTAPTAITAPPPTLIEVPAGDGTLEQAKDIQRQLKVSGFIENVRHNAREQRLVIPVSKPGEALIISVDLRTKLATVERQPRGLAAALVYLHKKPGPHNVKFRGNWIFMAWWAPLVDATVYGVLFLTVSGIYLWWLLKAERRVGWVLLATGATSFATLVFIIGSA